MNWKLVVGLSALLVTLSVSPIRLVAQDAPMTLTIWLIPSELASKDRTMDFDAFNNLAEVDGLVTVLNTKVPSYRDQLIAWNPEFAYPNFPIIKGQEKTLEALRRFARLNNVRVSVRFVWWGQAFSELRAVTEGKQSGMLDGFRIAPDVAQVGSTWVGYFAKSQALIPRVASDDYSWRDAPDAAAASLRYTTDVRLIFYWKRMSWPPTGKPFKLESDSYEVMLRSLAERSPEVDKLNPPMAMPIGLTQNILHDYAPLVWAGDGRFFDLNWLSADLTSEAALTVPRLLMERAVKLGEKNRRQRLLAFPEMSHEETVQHFLNGEYLAVIEPTNFIKRWRDYILDDWSDKEKDGLPPGFTVDGKRTWQKVNFWDYIGVAVPPRPFVGGSDLIVTSRVKDLPVEKEKSFLLAKFLATDKAYSTTLAELGTLPAQLQQLGEDVLRTSLMDKTAGPDSQEWATEFAIALTRALSRRKESEYPVLAEWPNMESREVLEALQRVWRRIGEGGDSEEARANLKSAAAEAELAVNQHYTLGAFIKVVLNRWGWVIVLPSTLISLLVAGLAFNQWRLGKNQIRVLKEKAVAENNERLALEQAEVSRKNQLLALRLYRAKVHEQLQAYRTRVHQFASSPVGNLQAALSEYEQHIREFEKHTAAISDAIAKELELSHDSMDAMSILEKAYLGAEIEFRVSKAGTIPNVSCSFDEDLKNWTLHPLPHLMVVILQEWFFNCLKEIAAGLFRQNHPSVIEVSLGKEVDAIVLRVISPSPISEGKAAKFAEPPSSSFNVTGQGIPLIRDLLWYGFAARAVCQSQPGGPTVLAITISFFRSDEQ